MHRASLQLMVLGLLFWSVSVEAKSRFERIEEGLYFGVHQTARGFQGGLLTDNVERNTKQLWQAAHEHCLKEGFAYLRSLGVIEIARDEELRAIWEVVGGGAMETSEVTAAGGGAGRANKIRRLLRFAPEPVADEDGWEQCERKPKGKPPENF